MARNISIYAPLDLQNHKYSKLYHNVTLGFKNYDNTTYLKTLASVWISYLSFNSGYSNKVSGATMGLMSSNAFSSKAIHLNVTLFYESVLNIIVNVTDW